MKIKIFSKLAAILLIAVIFVGTFTAVPLAASAAGPWEPWQTPTEWVQINGYWYFYKTDGTLATGWLTHNNSKYYFTENGTMVTGWLPLGEKWYYFNSEGAMTTGWIFDGSYWYFMNADGTMQPGIQESADWMLTLVNAWNPIPEDYKPRLKAFGGGWMFDERAVGELNAMLAAARSNGLSPIVTSAYRTVERQRVLFNNKVAELKRAGLDQEQAEIEAAKVVSRPGTSEHNMGLAVDIFTATHRSLNDNLETTPEIIWLTENCAEYGFILRYPKGKEHITGIIYEPWHFRYVGVNAAREIMSRGLTLEEYLQGGYSSSPHTAARP